MSRSLVATALLAFAVAGLLPVLAMATRVGAADLGTVLDARTLSLMGRTLALGVSVATTALAVGGTFGWLVARTDLPLAGVLRPLGVVPILLPTLMTAMAFVAFSELRGAAATVIVLATSSFPIVAMFTARAAERVDGRQVDAAWAAGGLPAVLRMELPLLLPPALAGACLAFVFAVNDFAVPDYVSSLGPKFNVYADEVFARWQTDHSTGSAVVSALPLVLLTLAALVPALVLRRRGAARTTGQSELVAPRALPLGRARWPLFGAAAALLLVTAVLPLGRLAWEAGGGTQGFALATLRAAFARALELARSNLGSSLLIAAAAATCALPLGLVIGHALARWRRAAWLEPWLALPFAVPAILFGIGTIAVWNRPATGALYDGPGLVVLMLVGRFGLFSILVCAAAVAGVDRRLEEAAELAGAGPVRRILCVVAPSVRPALWGAWIVTFVLAMRELDAAILVPAANRLVMFRVYNAVHFGRDDFVAALCLLVVFFIVLPALLWSLFARRRLEVLP